MSAEYSASVVEIGDRIAALSPSKAGDLLTYLKETYNIEPFGAPPIQEQPKEKQVEKAPEQTEFTLVLESYDQAKKISLVKSYREATGVGLKDAMAAINACPATVKENMPKAEAEKLKALLEDCGGTVTMK